jgi:hypothetical protein
MSLRDRLQRAAAGALTSDELYSRFGITENPFPSASQSSNNPHQRSSLDEAIDEKVESFIRDQRSEIVVLVGTQGVGKTNILNYYERELGRALPDLDGFYVIRYLSDPEASFDGVLRRLFQEFGQEHLRQLGRAIHANEDAETMLLTARGHEMRVALRRLAKTDGNEDVAEAMLEWLLGLRVLNRHKDLLQVHFRLDTVEAKTAALRDLVYVSKEAGLLNGIFLLLDELEKQDGVLSPTYVARYLSAMRALIDALPNHLFMMLAVTPDAMRRYSLALPAFRSRMQDQLELKPLSNLDDALRLANFYLRRARRQAVRDRGRDPPPTAEPVLSDEELEAIFHERFKVARASRDEGLRQRDLLHALHQAAESVIQGR